MNEDDDASTSLIVGIPKPVAPIKSTNKTTQAKPKKHEEHKEEEHEKIKCDLPVEDVYTFLYSECVKEKKERNKCFIILMSIGILFAICIQGMMLTLLIDSSLFVA